MQICPNELAGISKQQLPAMPQVGNFNENDKIGFIWSSVTPYKTWKLSQNPIDKYNHLCMNKQMKIF